MVSTTTLNVMVTPERVQRVQTAAIDPGPAPGQLRLSGAWVLHALAQLEVRAQALAPPPVPEIAIDASAVSAMDTAGAWLLVRTIRDWEAGGAHVTVRGMRLEFERLFKLVAARSTTAIADQPVQPGLLAGIGLKARNGLASAYGLLVFVGEAAVVLARGLLKPRRIRWRATLFNVETAGFEALPITGLLSFLLGIVIAYQGAEQLRRVGANIYIADLVGLSMVRELSPLITAIIVAGRSGSAYAAQIGTMKVTEEIDALRTIGIVPFELLVIPKLLALVLVLPLLTVYTNIMGLLGGMVMARSLLGVGFTTFLDRLGEAVSLTSYLVGVGKAPVFAAIIALVGCYQGFQVTGSAQSVGRQTTVSVVQSIFLVIVADALFSIVFSWLDI